MNFCSLRSLVARTLSLSLVSYVIRSEDVNISSGLSGGVTGRIDGTGRVVGKALCFRAGACRTSCGRVIFRRDGGFGDGQAVQEEVLESD